MYHSEDRTNVGNAIIDLAHTITPNCLPGTDAMGGTVTSLTEAIMGITSGLNFIGQAIYELAEVVRNTKED